MHSSEFPIPELEFSFLVLYMKHFISLQKRNDLVSLRNKRKFVLSDQVLT